MFELPSFIIRQSLIFILWLQEKLLSSMKLLEAEINSLICEQLLTPQKEEKSTCKFGVVLSREPMQQKPSELVGLTVLKFIGYFFISL